METITAFTCQCVRGDGVVRLSTLPATTIDRYATTLHAM